MRLRTTFTRVPDASGSTRVRVLQGQTRACRCADGAPAHDAFCENIMVGAKLAQSFLLKMGVATQEELERVYQRCLDEMNGQEFRAIWYYLRAWGRKL